MRDIERFPYYFGTIKNFMFIGRIYRSHDIYLIYIYFERHSRFWYERKSYLLSLMRISFELTGREGDGNSEQRLSPNRNEDESMQIRLKILYVYRSRDIFIGTSALTCDIFITISALLCAILNSSRTISVRLKIL